MILLIVDVQKAIVDEQLYAFHNFVENVSKLIEIARKNNIEVVYVRHDDGLGSDLSNGQEGFEIYEAFKPNSGELIFDKSVNSAFKESGLLEYLRNKGEKSIIIAGLQTDYCIDASVKAGFEHGFTMIVPKKANTTLDNSYLTASQLYDYYNNYMWHERYALSLSMEAVIEMMQK